MIPLKKWGQHFLIDTNIANKIIKYSNIEDNDIILEIGPGKGILTSKLFNNNTVVIEIDKRLIDILHDNQISNKLNIIHGNALSLDIINIVNNKKPTILISNLPYNIGTKLLLLYLDNILSINKCIVMLQKDTALRILSNPGGKLCGVSSLKVAFYGTAKLLFHVSRYAFNPVPNVDSSVIKIVRHTKYKDISYEFKNKLFDFITLCFTYRRKKLISILKKNNILLSNNLLYTYKDILNQRPEQLSLNDYITLVKNI